MRRLIYSLMMLTGALLAFAGYCAALIDWIQEYSSGYYTDHRIEQGLETAGIVIYPYCGIRFCRKNLDFPSKPDCIKKAGQVDRQSLSIDSKRVRTSAG